MADHSEAPGGQGDGPIRGGRSPVWPVEVWLLGEFGVLVQGRPQVVRGDTKTATLLSVLALHRQFGVPRDALLDVLWPNIDPVLASRSLHSLVHGLRKLLAASLGGATPVLLTGGVYRLNQAAGVGVDVEVFDALGKAGDRAADAGDLVAADDFYRGAVGRYRGDLCPSAGTDVIVTVERERLRARYLGLLACLADYADRRGDYAACLEHVFLLLASDPCREDAHRLAMRCYLRRGERTQSLRQYRVCEQILRAEFDAAPEPATTALFQQMRLDPTSI